MLCYNHLRMIGHGALLFQTQKGRLPKSLAELAEAGCAPGEFGADKYRCPDGGRYELADDGLTAVCSHPWACHGAGALLRGGGPNRSRRAKPAVQATSWSSTAAYWQRFFDPIAIRVRVTPDQYRAENDRPAADRQLGLFGSGRGAQRRAGTARRAARAEEEHLHGRHAFQGSRS